MELFAPTESLSTDDKYLSILMSEWCRWLEAASDERLSSSSLESFVAFVSRVPLTAA